MHAHLVALAALVVDLVMVLTVPGYAALSLLGGVVMALAVYPVARQRVDTETSVFIAFAVAALGKLVFEAAVHLVGARA